MDRILVAFKAMYNEVKRRLHPSVTSQVKMDSAWLTDEQVRTVLMYIVVYFIVVFVSIVAVLLCGSGVPEAVSGVIASVGSVGPGLAEIGSLDNYSAQPAMAKFIFAIDMFLGRVEIYPVLIVISQIFKRRG